MNNVLKFFLYVLIALVILLGGLFIAYRVFVGAVNVPMGEYELSPDALAERIKLPDGFSMGLYAVVENARLMRFTEAGDLLVAVPNMNRIVLLERDADHDGKADGQRVLMTQLNSPNGMDFREGYLYIAESGSVGRVPFDHEKGALAGEYETVVSGLPGGGNHWKKTLRFGPDDKMYLTVGSSCNVCIEEDERRGTMLRYNPDGSGEEIHARGLRNATGMDWAPFNGALYATDNGRDLLGDNFPPCELNRIVEGGHYGWPYANGEKIPDPDFGKGNEEIVANSIAPVHRFPAHNTPLSIVFIRGNAFPPGYRDAAVVALHGSWNRSEKDGYKVVSLHWDDEGNITRKDLVTGFLEDEHVIGRPAEVTQGPDGAIYVADDYAGAVYRIAWGEEQSLALPKTVTATYNAEQTLARLDPDSRAWLSDKGETLFKQYNCIQCHRSTEEGGLKELEDLGSKYNLDTMSGWLKKPNAPMPLFPLSEQDRRALAVYLIETY